MIFDDNRLLPALFGERNAHLHLLEQILGIQIRSKGNELTLVGRHADTIRAREILEILWGKLRSGEDIDHQTVDAALRFSIADKENIRTGNGQGMTNSPTNLQGFANTKIQIALSKKTITPR